MCYMWVICIERLGSLIHPEPATLVIHIPQNPSFSCFYPVLVTNKTLVTWHNSSLQLVSSHTILSNNLDLVDLW